MIRSYRHKGLERFFTRSERKGIDVKYAARIRRMLDRLEASTKPEDMNLPGYAFHGLTGDRKGAYSIRVSGNWRITFSYEGENATHVNLEDYHS